MLFKTLLLVTVVSLAAADTANLNQLADQLVASLNDIIRKGGKDEIEVAGFKNDWHQRWHFIKVSGNFNCHNGKVRSLASIKRTGDATMTTDGNKVTLKVALGLQNLEADFKECQVKVHRIGSASSKVRVDVDSNSIEAQVSLTGYGASCVASVDHVAINNLGRISVHTGGGLFKSALNRILDAAGRHFHGHILEEANKEIAKAASEALPKADLCNKIPH